MRASCCTHPAARRCKFSSATHCCVFDEEFERLPTGNIRAYRLQHASPFEIAPYLLGFLFETVREPLVVLDGDFRIISANRAFYQTFQVTLAETEHQLLYDLGNRQWDIPRLRELLEHAKVVVPFTGALELTNEATRLFLRDDLVAIASEEIAIRAILDHEIETYDPYEGEVLVWQR